MTEDLTMKLSDELVQIVEANGFAIDDIIEQDGDYYAEMCQFTPEGEDWNEAVWFDGTDEDFVCSVTERAESFDVDEEVEVWISFRGTYGVPNSISDLLCDAEWKQSTLKMLASDLKHYITVGVCPDMEVFTTNKQKRTKLREADSLLSTARQIISQVKDREQDDLDNLPENLQGSERCAVMESAVDELEDAMESIDRASESVNNAM